MSLKPTPWARRPLFTRWGVWSIPRSTAKPGIVTREETPESVADSVLALLNKPAEYDRLRVNAWERAKTFAWQKVLPPACDWLEEQARRRSRFLL